MKTANSHLVTLLSSKSNTKPLVATLSFTTMIPFAFKAALQREKNATKSSSDRYIIT
jgi:hypothetical protein